MNKRCPITADWKSLIKGSSSAYLWGVQTFCKLSRKLEIPCIWKEVSRNILFESVPLSMVTDTPNCTRIFIGWWGKTSKPYYFCRNRTCSLFFHKNRFSREKKMFASRVGFPLCPKFTLLHNDPAALQDHCGRCRIRTGTYIYIVQGSSFGWADNYTNCYLSNLGLPAVYSSRQ